jgi:tight adherence protein C
MTLLFLVSVGVTLFLLAATIILMFSGEDTIDARLTEISVPPAPIAPTFTEEPKSGLARAAFGVTGIFKPIRSLVSGSDADLSYRLTLAGFRKPEHVEIFAALKMLLPLVFIVAGSFFGSNMLAAILVGAVVGFMLPDFVLTHFTSRRQDSIRRTLPDALDLLVICMEAGLGIDQAMVRVGDEIKRTAPYLCEEFQIINREQRAGKPRLDAWRSMAARVDVDHVRQFVTMLVQTERFGTPIANALGQFADSLRTRRAQVAEEAAAKTGVKLLFPLIIFILPTVFVVTLGPAILNIQKVFSDLMK